MQPLVSNDWTILRVNPPAAASPALKPADLEPFPDDEKELHVKYNSQHPFAWRGTLLPKSDKDVWLAAGFAEYENVIALEKAVALETKEQPEKSKPVKSPADGHASRDLVDLALFEHESKWLTAARRLGRDVPLGETTRETISSNWYDIAKGKGVILLASLRTRLGAEVFDRLMDEFGVAHAGREVGTDEFVDFFEKHAGQPAAEIFKVWLAATAPFQRKHRQVSDNPWTIYSFRSPRHEQALIVYGTVADRAAQKEAAELLQRALARRFANYSIPIKADADVTETELSGRHVLLVGRPATNQAAARLSAKLPVSFAAGSISVRGETYAHCGSAVIATGDNALNSRYSVVIYAGPGSGSDPGNVCSIMIPEELATATGSLLRRRGRKPARFRVASNSSAVAMP